jgi:hypothetical protein
MPIEESGKTRPCCHMLPGMSRDFFDLIPEEQEVVFIDAVTVQKAQRMITGCEACLQDPGDLFASILDVLTGCDPTITDYVLERPTRCLQCGAEVDEKTLVEWELGNINE